MVRFRVLKGAQDRLLDSVYQGLNFHVHNTKKILVRYIESL